MIRIWGFIHREALQDLIGRWMLDRLEPSDRMALMRLVHFNSVYVARYLPLLTEGLLHRLHGCHLTSRMSLNKGDLKDQLIAHRPAHLRTQSTGGSERTSRLIAAYQAEPGLFYRETPFRGILYLAELDGRPTYVGSNRIKRIRRLAEKSARKVVDWLHAEIKRQAERDQEFNGALADALKHAEPPELERVEGVLMRRLRDTPPAQWPDDLEINDVAGIKVVIEPDEEEPLLGALQDLGCRLVEREPHTGAYTALNLIVDYQPDKARILAQALPAKVIGVFREHGIQAGEANRWFDAFVRSGEASVRVEIICSDYEQTLEGEIGRCMHEDRIIRQRQRREYQGHLAQNVEFLLELLFTLPAAPDVRLERLPVRLWDRYLPDYFDEVKRALFHLPSVELNLD
jgi:hypothetical protein